ncbi:MAG: endopeptidase La [Spirochaetales bacterium]
MSPKDEPDSNGRSGDHEGVGSNELSLIPLKEIVAFPGMSVPLFLGKNAASELPGGLEKDAQVVLCTQRFPKPDPGPEDFYDIGCRARTVQSIRHPDGSTRVLLKAIEAVSIERITRNSAHGLSAEVRPVATVRTTEDESSGDSAVESQRESEQQLLTESVRDGFRRIAANAPKRIPNDVYKAIDAASDPPTLANLVAGYSPISIERKVELLRISDPRERLEELVALLESEIGNIDLRKRIQSRVKKRLEKSQRDHFLQEQKREIDRELGQEDDDPSGAGELEKRLAEKQLPEEVRSRCDKELTRLKRLQPVSPEAGIIRTWLDWIVDLPWSETSTDYEDLKSARAILDSDHFDMERPKERILDYLAVHTLKPDQRGPILCFVGPPGTGKTSLGASLARSLGREFLRISLGGVRDEAEIRGHRKTYVGALPGKIIQSLRKVKTANPVFLLDEVDKMASDFRGDPASALLEVLDPEQNQQFVDHYLEVPFDLSRTIFLTTANSLHQIPYPLRDRMEIIEIPGYTEQEKTRIAEDFLIPKQRLANGLGKASVRFQKSAIGEIIRNYTAESGVRELERQIGTVVRKLARRALSEGISNEKETERFRASVTPKTVRKALGKPRASRDLTYPEPRIGLARGLAWTERGGTLLPVEATDFTGTGQLILTGSLGDVMKESGRLAMSFIRNHSHRFGIDERTLDSRDIHLHVPHGAIPKDGPSAGIALTVAILSALTGIAAHPHIAMTGEITLTGRVIAVGGIKEKVLAALRNEVSHVILPEDNRNDQEDLPAEVFRGLTLEFTTTLMEALAIAFPPALFEIRSR